MVARIFVSCGVLLICTLLAGGVERDALGATGMREFTGSLAPNEEFATFNTRTGVTTRVVITKPTGAPKGIFLFYPGGRGFVVNRRGKFRDEYRREIARRGYIAAMVDVPSDQPSGLMDCLDLERFRVKAEHTQDARAVIDALYGRWQLPVYLIGQSMGAISVAHIAATLDDRRLNGVILLSSPSERCRWASGGLSLPDAQLDKITVPVLLVHHLQDGCRGATFETASTYPPLFTASPRVGFIEVDGGKTPLRDDPCRMRTHHSFYGQHDQVIEAVIQWINGKDIRSVK